MLSIQAKLSGAAYYLPNKEVDSFTDQTNEIRLMCRQYDIQCHRSDDALVLSPGSVTTQQGEIYKVFTPFKRAWINQVEGNPMDLMTIDHFEPRKNPLQSEQISLGETAASNSLNSFISQAVYDYKDKRDIPNETATSGLSAHLSAGSISPRTCLQRVITASNFELSAGSPGITNWVSQLAWREFYSHLIATQNRLSKAQPFKSETNNIKWNKSSKAFDDWKKGLTGVPIVDVGMRQGRCTIVFA